MAFINRMKGQDYIDKTREYLDYLEEHLENVRVAFIEVTHACEGMPWVGDDFSWFTLKAEVECHDLSKFSPEEFVQYRNSFFPVSEKDREESGMDKAWENHKKANHHHHESVDNYLDVVHMVVDWTAMGYKFKDTAQSYYEKNKDRIMLDDSYVPFMYEIFEKIANHQASS